MIEGNVDLRATIDNLRSTLGKLSKDTQNATAKVIFGQTAMTGWLSIINADAEALGTLTKAVDEASESNGEFTRKLAYDMNNNLAGDIRTLKSTIEESFLTIFQNIQKPLRDCVQGLTTAIRKATEWFNGLDKSAQTALVKFVGLTAVVAPLVSMFGFLVSGIGHSVTAFGKLVGVTGKAKEQLSIFRENGLTLKNVLSTLCTGTKNLGSMMKGTLGGAVKNIIGLFTGKIGLSTVVSSASGLFSSFMGVLGTLASSALPVLATALVTVGALFGDNESILTGLIDRYGKFGEVLSRICEFINGTWKMSFGQLGNTLKGLGKSVVAIFKGDFSKLDDIWSETWSQMQITHGEAMENITTKSTSSIKKLRQYTEQDVKHLKKIYEDAYGQLSQTTTLNYKNVAKNITDMFKDSRGKTVALAQESIDIMSGTSDTMRILFSGIKQNMDISEAEKKFTKNLSNLLNTGKTTPTELAKDFEKAWKTIDKNILDGGTRIKQNASKILDEFNQVASGKIDQGVDDIVDILDDLDVRGVESLRGIGANWNKIFQGVSTDSKMTAEEMKNAILKTIQDLGLDTPEKLAEFKETLKYELATTKLEVLQDVLADGMEIGSELVGGMVDGVSDTIDTATGVVTESAKKVTDGAKEGLKDLPNGVKDVAEQATTSAKESFEKLPTEVKKELEKAGVTINDQGNVIVEDMAKKGKQGAKAYVDEMNAQLPQLSGVAGTIQQQLDGINKVRFGGVTKQLSEINKWLNTTKNSAVRTGASLAEITTVTFGKTTKGLSEIDKWLKNNVTKDAEKTKSALKEITTVTFGKTTKGLSEVTKWLKNEVTPKANTARTSLQNLANVRFGGVTSSLSNVVNMLEKISNKAKSTGGAINRMITSSERSMSPIEYEVKPMPVAEEVSPEFARFKTSGGFYSSNSIAKANADRSSLEQSRDDSLLKSVLEQNQILLKLLNVHQPIEVAVNMDGRQVAKASARYINEEINSITRRSNRLGGIV